MDKLNTKGTLRGGGEGRRRGAASGRLHPRMRNLVDGSKIVSAILGDINGNWSLGDRGKATA